MAAAIGIAIAFALVMTPRGLHAAHVPVSREVDRFPRRSAASPGRGCVIEGGMALSGFVTLSAERADEVPFATFNDHELALESTFVGPFAEARLRLKATAAGGFSLEGWMQRGQLRFAARRRIPLAGEAAYVPVGAPLTLSTSIGHAAVVSPVSNELILDGVVTPCADVAIGRVLTDAPTSYVVPASATVVDYHLGGSSLGIALVPGGPSVFEMTAQPGLRVKIEESSLGLHLHYEDGLVVDGWVRREELRVAKTHRFRPLGCGFGTTNTGPTPLTARRAIALRDASIWVGEKPSGEPRGTLALGGDVIVLSSRDGFHTVLPRCGELVPEDKMSFFVEDGALVIGAEEPFTALRAGCPRH